MQRYTLNSEATTREQLLAEIVELIRLHETRESIISNSERITKRRTTKLYRAAHEQAARSLGILAEEVAQIVLPTL